MKTRVRDYDEWHAALLRDPKEMAAYLRAHTVREDSESYISWVYDLVQAVELCADVLEAK